jgi:hypothetical protein
MNIFTLIALNFVPLLAVFLIFVIAVPGQKIRYALLSCLLGLLTVIPASFVQYYILGLPIFMAGTAVNLLITAIIFNGLIEESFKMLFMAFLPQKKLTLPAFFSCALLAGLTLGSFESVIYLIKRLNESTAAAGPESFYTLLLTRSLTSVIIHTFCAGLGGLYLWFFKTKNSHLMPFVWAVLLHGAYNFFAGFKSGFYSFAVIAILFTILECRIWYKTADNAPSLNGGQTE